MGSVAREQEIKRGYVIRSESRMAMWSRGSLLASLPPLWMLLLYATLHWLCFEGWLHGVVVLARYSENDKSTGFDRVPGGSVHGALWLESKQHAARRPDDVRVTQYSG